jgi:FixJ family two-component response regulator
MSEVRKPVVAVVDDDLRVLESLEDLLESDGYCTRTFLSARAFLESGVLLSICCLICDVYMPTMTGWELEERASQVRPGLPVILITGNDATPAETQPSRGEERRRVLFRKPFDGQKLLAAVDAALIRQGSKRTCR